MFKISILFIAFIFPLSLKADVEFNQKIEILARSFPIGGFSKFSAEILKTFWGKKTNPKSIEYGFYGIQGSYRTSILVNYISSQVFIYPVPILGIFVGKEQGLRSIKRIDTFNCKEVICEGQIDRSFIGSRLALAYKNIFFFV